MDDLSAILNRVLSDPESMRQLEEAAASLGLTGDGQNAAPAQYQASPPRPANRGMGMPGRRNTYQNKLPTPTRQREEELAEIRRLLEQLSGGRTPAPSPGTAYQPDYEPVEDNVPDIDVGAISDIIAGLTGKPRQAPASSPQDSGNLDLSALLSSLGGQSQSHQQQQSPDLSALLSGLAGQGQSSQQQGGNLDLSTLLNSLGEQSQSRQQQTPDLSALLSGLAGQGQSSQQQGGNLDLSALLSSLGGQSQSRQQQTPDLSALLSGLASQGQSSQKQGGNLDLSALLGSLGGGSGSGGGVDLSGLQGILSGLTGGGGAPAAPSTASTLAAMLGGGGSDAGPIPGGMDMGMLLKFQQAMSSIGANAGNVRLLMAVKSHLKDEERREKVDDAIKVMQVVQFLPLLKESGLFGKMEEILDGFNLGGLLGGGRRSGSEGQGQGGFSLGNLFGGRNSSGGLGGLLSSLTGGR